MVFLMDFTPRPNPSVLGRRSWSTEERRGAVVFRDRCESCHAARLVTDRPDSVVSFGEWERLVMSPTGPIVWARESREKTGVTPYVHDEGTRVPSLRRLYRKRPYFTNGSAPDLDALLRRARFTSEGFLHDGGGRSAGDRLDDSDRAALLAFLDLL
jgi:cytochrome c